MVVADGTRAITLDIALSIRERVESEHGALPFVMLLNKHDLLDQWVTPDSTLEALRARGWSVRLSSARSGEGVDEAFTELAERVTR
jgi:signal recognition particle receptor subunit beta